MIFRYGSFVIGQIEYLYFIIPLMILLFFILRKSYINEEQRIYKKKGKKRFIFFIRFLLFLFLMLALSDPYLERKETQGNFTKINVLIDDSDSTKLYDIQIIEDSLAQLNKKGISLDIEKLNLGDFSSLGTSLLNNLEPAQNILLVSDGQNNFGSSMEDVSLFASSINSKIFGITLESKKDDANIVIEGPSKVVAEVENSFNIKVNQVGKVNKKNVKVYFDDVLAYDSRYEKEIEIKKSFSSGTHVIKAVLETEDNDLFQENNIFYKTISVYKKLKVLFISEKGSPLESLYSSFYNIELKNKLPEKLDDYYTVILNNLDAEKLSYEDISKLGNYVSDGNGLLVIGGKESYDWGDYNTSLISNLLPVSLGKANKKKDITNVVILMDTGASGGEDLVTGISYFDVQKTLAADIVKSISPTNKVALIEGNYYLNTISGLSDLGPKRAQLINDIGLLKPTGFSELRFAYEDAHEMLRLTKGSKNIVIITDGKLVPADQEITLKYVTKAYDDGIKTFIIGVGDNADDSFLKSIKELGGGEYFKANEKNKISIYFGNPADNPQDDLKMFIYDSNHFITKDTKELGRIYGFNTVYPKSTARLLITTTTGDPILTVWNYGLGRVASLSTDDGSAWVPDLLGKESSAMLIKTMNWLIEDPERKNPVIIEIPELRLKENSVITVRSAVMPKTDTLTFYETSKGIFKANYYPNQTGIISLIGMPMAVNYKKEYLNIGINSNLERILSISGGELIENNPDTIAEKIKSAAKIETLKKISLSWVFILGAIVIYLTELLIRRIYEMKLHQ